MLENYEININTLAIIPIDTKISKVIEIDNNFIVKRKTTEIVDYSCKYFGSSYIGRQEGTKNLIGINYKCPIVVEETREIIFFPTSSPRFSDCFWISLNNINSYKKFNGSSKIIFNNNEEIIVNISYESLQNQILRATMLESVLRKRKNL